MADTLAGIRERLAATRGYAALRELRRMPDRLLHPRRRRATLRELRKMDRPATAVFVCYGNICRSPYAAAAFARSLPPELGGIRVLSAGMVGAGRPAPREGIAVASRRGIDLAGHRATLLTRELARTAGLVVVMSEEQRRSIRRDFGREEGGVVVLGDLDPLPIDLRTLRDPWRQPERVFEESYDRIDRCIREMVAALAGSAVLPEPAGAARG
jgi:protein-tyrosine phosphatase